MEKLRMDSRRWRSRFQRGGMVTGRSGSAGCAFAALCAASGATYGQQLTAIPEGTPLVIGPGTQGLPAYVGPAATDFFWFCDFDALGHMTNIGEIAEEVHLRQAGNLASFTFRYFTAEGPGTGTATATINVYLNDETDSIEPHCGLIASYTIPNLPYSSNTTLFEQTFDIPQPLAVPKDLWIGVRIDVPTDPLTGGLGCLAGAGAFGANPTVRYGTSHNVVWFSEDCPPAGVYDLGDNYGIVANHNLTVRVFPDVDCPSPVPNGDFESTTPLFQSWGAAGTRWILAGYDAQTPPTSGNFVARLDTNGTNGSSLASFLGIPVSTLDSLSSGTPVLSGSAVRQTISVAAGDTLSFDWNFATNEPTPNAARNDFGFVTFTSGGSTMLADTFFNPFLPMQQTGTTFSGGTFLEESGFQQYARTFTAPATITIGLGSANQGTTSNQKSALILDRVQLTHGAGPNQSPTCSEDLSSADADFLHTASGYVITEGENLLVPFTGTDPDGGLLMMSASGLPAGASIGPASGAAPLVATLSWTPTAAEKALAPYLISVKFTDPAGSDTTCYLIICDVNLRPVCTASDQTLECAGSEGALVTLDGSATDADDPASSLTYNWFVSDASVTLDDPSSPTPTGIFPIGVTMATLTVADGRGGVAVCDVQIAVQDTHPPEVQCTTDIAALWPPKHAMVPVNLVVTAIDACSDPEEILPISVRVSSSEPDDANGSGDGNTKGDVHGQDAYAAPVVITSGFTYDAVNARWSGTVLLRAERNGTGPGRKYTLDVTASDSQGNAASTSCCVVVPHDRRADS